MAFPQGIDFRATAGFVTDPTNYWPDTWSNTAVSEYPTTTTQGNTVGYENRASGSTADRNASIDARLAGIHYVNTAQATFRIDLPSTGSYNIGCGAGDDSANNPVYVELFDTNTSLGQIVPLDTSPGAGNFYDATDTKYTAAAWPGSQKTISKTFTTTICRFKLGDNVNLCVWANIFISSGGGGGSSPGPFYSSKLDGIGGGGYFRGNRIQ